MNITEFLLTQIAEDEAAVQAAQDRPWYITSTPWGKTFEPVADDPTHSNTDHHLAIDPARVLAVCEAHRRIVEEHAEDHHCVQYTHPDDNRDCRTLRALAAIYSDAPGFREEWAL